MSVDDGHPAAVDEHPVEAAVVDGDPAALVEPQHQVGAGDQGVGDADVGAQITADDDVVAGREGAWRPVVPNGQRRRVLVGSSGPTLSVLGPDAARADRASGRRLDAPPGGVGDLLHRCDLAPRVVMTWARRGVDGGNAVAGRAPVPADHHHPLVVNDEVVEGLDMHLVKGGDPPQTPAIMSAGPRCSPPTPRGMPALTVPTKSSVRNANRAIRQRAQWRRRSAGRPRWEWALERNAEARALHGR